MDLAIKLIVLLPLLAAAIAGLFCRIIGDRPAQIVTCAALLIAAALSIFVFVRIGFGPENAKLVVVKLFTWMDSGTLNVDWSLRVDTLTAVMLIVVTVVSSMVHVYSVGYMVGDPGIPRFMAYLSLFTFFMLMLVTADNLVQLFFGWEGVGLASYLLIGFWYDKPSANAAAMKAFIVNRIGDFGFALGIFAVWMLSGSIGYADIFAKAPEMAQMRIHFLGMDLPALETACLLLFVGAMGKSAQLGLHTWLPDAMEGPTPVSALIHAATMVTAGVFMVCRLSPLFELAPIVSAFVTLVGAATAFFAATIGLTQFDIKRVVAYSTCSQLGYMFFAAGVGSYSGGDVPPHDTRLLQGTAVPGLGLGHHRAAPRAGHAQDGRRQGEDSADLLADVGRHPGAVGHRRALHPGQRHRLLRLLLQGHVGGIGLWRAHHRRPHRLLVGRLCRLHDGVLFDTPDVPDLLRQVSRRSSHLGPCPRIARGHPDPALCAGGRRAPVGLHRLRLVRRSRLGGILGPVVRP